MSLFGIPGSPPTLFVEKTVRQEDFSFSSDFIHTIIKLILPQYIFFISCTTQHINILSLLGYDNLVSLDAHLYAFAVDAGHGKHLFT